ncbi:MAG: HAMP domain-containing sensor histidine kinase [Pseudomonadota bacterium]|jgi:signal transduction histidine kinase
MLRTNSLRFRAAVVFALFGALLAAALSGGVYWAAKDVGRRLMSETLRAELEDSAARHARDQTFVPPNTVSIKGYVLSEREPDKLVPDAIRTLAPGKHYVDMEGTNYYVLVADRNDGRYFMLYNTQRQRHREARFLNELALFFFLMTVASAVGGFWLAARIVTPVSRLADWVGQAEPGILHMPPAKLMRNDEVGELARAFERYVQRLSEFIEREKNFTGDVSHELRTPLAVILGSVEVLEQDERLDAKQRERLARIKYSGREMVEMMRALLLMSRERKVGADEPLCQVAPVVHEVVERHAAALRDSAVALQLETTGDPALIVERSLLAIVVDNLLRNAAFHTRQGHIRIVLGADRLEVSDTGIGMTPEELAHAFDRYYKGKASAGFGVGLSLVKRICERYGWQVAIDSRPGEGTRVTLHFAAVQA